MTDRKNNVCYIYNAKGFNLKTEDFNYTLPDELIAQVPAPIRDECRLLAMNKHTGKIADTIFNCIIDYLHPDDLLVANETRVLPARLLGKKHETGGAAEVFLLRHARPDQVISSFGQSLDDNQKSSISLVPTNKQAYWEALVRPGKRLKPGALIDFYDENNTCVMQAEVLGFAEEGTTGRGQRVVRLSTVLSSLDEALHKVGKTPLPPYIKNYLGNTEMYQTVYSKTENSAAAPTAGLHFTPELISRIQEKGVDWKTVDLQVGLDTFRVVDEDDPHSHCMHTERYTVPQSTVDAVHACKERGGRVIAVGTTSVRSLESAALLSNSLDQNSKTLQDEDALGNSALRDGARRGKMIEKPLLRACTNEATSLYILPGYKFQVVDALITNFHVPKSTLLMLVSALSSRNHIMNAYNHAIEQHYRFFSFGDAMFIY